MTFSQMNKLFIRFKKAVKDLLAKIYKDPRPSAYDIGKKLEKYLDYENGFFIEAGANDGYAQSNTYYLEKKKGWEGILVEGIPELYAKCKKERKNSAVFNYALVGDDYEKETAKMRYANLMSVVDGALKSEEAQDAHLARGLKVQRIEESYDVDVDARTLEAILDSINNLPNLDFLSLDVEGYELNVLKGLNLERYKPTYILVEASFFDEIDDYLSDQYELVEKMSRHDYLYKLKAFGNGQAMTRSQPVG